MLTKITYNCEPDTLGDISQTEYVEALENEFWALAKYQYTSLHVTFHVGKSMVTDYESDDEVEPENRWDELQKEFCRLAEKAWEACLQNT